MAETVFQANVHVPGAAPLKPVDPAQFRNVVENRRSVRVYDGSPVSEQVMRDIFDLTLLAPNSSNLQPWEFYWVRSADKKQALVEACFSQNAARTAAELVVAVARIDKVHPHRKQMLRLLKRAGSQTPKMLTDYYAKLVPLAYATGPFSLLAPIKWLTLTTMGFFRPVPREPLTRGGLKLWASKTTALACENFMLAATAHGLDTCPMEGLDSHRVRKLLGVPRSAVVVMAIAVGRRSPKGVYGERIRFPSAQFVKEL